SSLLGAFDYLAFALYYSYLRKKAEAFGTNQDFLPALGKWINLQWLFFITYSILAFILPLGLFNIAHYAAFILFFYPLALYITIRMRPTREQLGEETLLQKNLTAQQ